MLLLFGTKEPSFAVLDDPKDRLLTVGITLLDRVASTHQNNNTNDTKGHKKGALCAGDRVDEFPVRIATFTYQRLT